MEPETIVVLVFTAAFFGLCVWVEINSRRQKAVAAAEESGELRSPDEERPETQELSRRRKRLRS